jgi:hypothetical protein
MLLFSLPIYITSFVQHYILNFCRLFQKLVKNFLPLKSKIFRYPSPPSA